MTDKTREDFEAWASDDWQWPQCVERTGDAYKLMQTKLKWEAWKEATQQSAARIAALEAEVLALREAINKFARDFIAGDVEAERGEG